jgi:hypothetical protein
MKARLDLDAAFVDLLDDILLRTKLGQDLALACFQALREAPEEVRNALLRGTGIAWALRHECLERGVISVEEHLP